MNNHPSRQPILRIWTNIFLTNWFLQTVWASGWGSRAVDGSTDSHLICSVLLLVRFDADGKIWIRVTSVQVPSVKQGLSSNWLYQSNIDQFVVFVFIQAKQINPVCFNWTITLHVCSAPHILCVWVWPSVLLSNVHGSSTAEARHGQQQLRLSPHAGARLRRREVLNIDAWSEASASSASNTLSVTDSATPCQYPDKLSVSARSQIASYPISFVISHLIAILQNKRLCLPLQAPSTETTNTTKS